MALSRPCPLPLIRGRNGSVSTLLNYNLKHPHVDHRMLASSFFLCATANLNDVATERAPQALLFGIVELIIGEIPGVLHLRLGHVLS